MTIYMIAIVINILGYEHLDTLQIKAELVIGIRFDPTLTRL